MPGRHEAPGLGRFYRQLVGFLVLLGAAGVLVVGGAVFLDQRVLSSGSPPSATVADTTTSTTTPTRTTARPTGTTTTTTSITTTTTRPTTTVSTLRDPSEIILVVLNGTGRSGLAARVTDELTEAGYRTLEPANADRAYSTSRILYAPGFGAEALRLGEAFPDAIVEEHPGPDPPADLVVILGASFED